MRRRIIAALVALLATCQWISPASAGYSLKIEPERTTGFKLSAFKTWIDADGNGCDTKSEVLIADATTKPKIGKNCALSKGSWLNAYDGKMLSKLANVGVDHLVPLAEVWRSGAWQWSPADRAAYANDLTNPDVLVVTSLNLIKSKGDKDPSRWLPSAGRCDYLRKWISIKAKYGLSVDPKEAAFLTASIEPCAITGVTLGSAFSEYTPEPLPDESTGPTLVPLPKPTNANIPTPSVGNYRVGELLWSDEFDAPGELNSQYWTARYCGQVPENGGGTCHNNESQYYIPEAIKVDASGAAIISTDRISSPPATGTCKGSRCEFTSGRFDTQGKLSFQYGYIETRIKTPSGAGNWPAFWMLGDIITKTGWPSSGEVDIMEQWRHEPTRNSAATHYLDKNRGHRYDYGEIYLDKDLSEGFHTYGLAWFPDRLEFYADGTLFFRELRSGNRTCDYTAVNKLDPDCTSQALNWPYNAPFFLIINNAITDQSGNFNLWDGWASSNMAIDYVRAFEIEGVGKVYAVK